MSTRLRIFIDNNIKYIYNVRCIRIASPTTRSTDEMIVDIAAIELGTGMKYDGDAFCFTGVFSGYVFVLSIDGEKRRYKLDTWVSDGAGADAFLKDFSEKELCPVSCFSCVGNTVSAEFDETDDVRYDCEEIASFLHLFSAFLSANGYRPCCRDCGGGKELSLVKHGGTLVRVCACCLPAYREEIVPEAGYVADETLERDEYGYISPRKTDVDFTAQQHGIFEMQRELEKGSNILFGIMGTLAGALAAAVVWIFLGQMRFLPVVPPLVLVFLCVYAYRFSAGVLDTRGVVVCAAAVLATVPAAELCSDMLYVWTELDNCGGVLSLTLVCEWLSQYFSTELFGNGFSMNLFVGYIIAAVAFVFCVKMNYMKIKVRI